MLATTGYFDAAGNPRLKFYIGGVFVDHPGVEMEAIIDTGFTGFLALPMVQAFPLGLPLLGTTSIILADGQTSTCLTALSKVTIADRTEDGVVMLQSNAGDALIGMDFLRRFRLTLFMTSSLIFLADEKLIDAFMKKASASSPTKKIEAAPDEGPSTAK